MASEKDVVSVPLAEFHAGFAEGKERDGVAMPIHGMAVSQIVPERRLRFSDAAWSNLCSASDIDICIGASHESVWIDADSVVGLASVDRNDNGRAFIEGFLDEEDDRARRMYPRLKKDSPYYGHFAESIGGLMRGVTRLINDPQGAEFLVGDWNWNHILIVRSDSRVHKAATVEAGHFADKLYMAAVASADGDEMDGLAVEVDCYLYGPIDFADEIESQEQAIQAIRALDELLVGGLNLACVSSKPWGAIIKGRKNFKASQFLYVGDPKKKSTWKFPVREPGGALNINAVYAAAQRLSSTTPEVRRVVAGKLRSIYKNVLNKPAPDSLKTAEMNQSEVINMPIGTTITERVADILKEAQRLDRVVGLSEEQTAPPEEETNESSEEEEQEQTVVEESSEEKSEEEEVVAGEESTLMDRILALEEKQQNLKSESEELRKRLGLAGDSNEEGAVEEEQTNEDEGENSEGEKPGETDQTQDEQKAGEQHSPDEYEALKTASDAQAQQLQAMKEKVETLEGMLQSRGEEQGEIRLGARTGESDSQTSGGIGLFSGPLSPQFEISSPD